jgi:hypothetical protein
VIKPEFGVVDVSPGTDVRPIIGTFGAASFQDTVRRVGEEPVDIATLPRLSVDRRQVVDDVLIRALGLRLASPPRGAPTRARCTRIAAQTATETVLPAGGLTLRAGPQPVDVFVRRYSDAPAGRMLGTVAARGSQELVAPPDRSRRPWRVRLGSNAAVRACGA